MTGSASSGGGGDGGGGGGSVAISGGRGALHGGAGGGGLLPPLTGTWGFFSPCTLLQHSIKLLSLSSCSFKDFNKKMTSRSNTIACLKGRAPNAQREQTDPSTPSLEMRLFQFFRRPCPFTSSGNKEADEDIAAFYRAKEELERRKSVAGRSGDTSY